MKKIGIQENGEPTVISFTSDNEFFAGKTESFPVIRFLLELTQQIPPKGCQYIRRYGLYASRGKGKWPDKPHVARLAPPGWKKERLLADSVWLIAQVYEVDPLVCPRCSAPIRYEA